jgi:hypothetical protein
MLGHSTTTQRRLEFPPREAVCFQLPPGRTKKLSALFRRIIFRNWAGLEQTINQPTILLFCAIVMFAAHQLSSLPVKQGKLRLSTRPFQINQYFALT